MEMQETQINDLYERAKGAPTGRYSCFSKFMLRGPNGRGPANAVPIHILLPRGIRRQVWIQNREYKVSKARLYQTKERCLCETVCSILNLVTFVLIFQRHGDR